jgi:energy-coupling factor transporter transmembrane protein EcfT
MKKFIPLLVPILIYAIRSINLQAMALESKCFNLTKDRTFYFKLEMKNSDYAIIFILFCVCIITLYLRISGYGAVLPRL